MKVKIKVKYRSHYNPDEFSTVEADSPEAAIIAMFPNAEGLKEWKPGVFVATDCLMGMSSGYDNVNIIAWEIACITNLAPGIEPVAVQISEGTKNKVEGDRDGKVE